MANATTNKVHLITGGFPRGALAGHDMDYARLRLLQFLAEQPHVVTTVSADFTDIQACLADTHLLITYVAGPYPNEEQNQHLNDWLEQGGRWFALHGTSGGKAARVKSGRTMVKTSHHQTLGGFFLNHPPLRRFAVQVNGEHPLAHDLPASFDVDDELYLIEMQGEHQVLLSTQIDKDPSPPGFGFAYDKDTSAQADGKTRVLAFSREVGKGGVTYISLGHCHSPASNSQPFVDDSVADAGITPGVFRGAWETPEFEQLLRNCIAWGLQAA